MAETYELPTRRPNRTLLQWIRGTFGIDSGTWPPEPLRSTWEEIEKFAAFRTSDAEVLRMLDSVPWYSRYMISPVPRMVSRSKAHLLFGEPPEITAENEADQERLDYVVSENELDTELHRAAMISSSEGEVWGRILVRPELLDVPIIEFVSRRNVIPHFRGRFCIGTTFVCEWELGSNTVLRLFETYAPQQIVSTAFYGTRSSLGSEVALDTFPETAGTPPVVLTGEQQPLCAFIPNSIDSDPSRGYADYAGLEDRFLSINRASSIGDTNTELAGKKRALVDGNYIGTNGELSGDDLFISHEDMNTMPEGGPLQIIEYDYDAAQIVTWIDHLLDSTLIYGGAAPQIVGRNTDGGAVSGVALRLKMIHSTLESSGSGRYFDRGLKRLLRFAAIIDSRSPAEIGFGRGWTAPAEKPGIERADALPRDEVEAATVLSTLVGAESISVEERVAFRHPDWPEDRRTEEIARLKKEAEESRALPAPAFPGESGADPERDPVRVPA